MKCQEVRGESVLFYRHDEKNAIKIKFAYIYYMKKWHFIFGLYIFFVACSTSTVEPSSEFIESSSSVLGETEVSSSSFSDGSLFSVYDAVTENGIYTSRDSVAAYLCKFGVLPQNYVDKATGKALYEEEMGKAFSKWNFNPWTTIGVMIGGDTFNNYADSNNYHSSLPEGSYKEADVDYYAENRGTKRLVYADECVIYWTADHYETFTLMEFQ